MLSILIPTFNYDVKPLVHELHKQATKENIAFEIIVYDDGSNSVLNKKNNTINTLNNCYFKALNNNIGRSAIRNLLARNAKFENLLFIDAGTFPKENNFINQYLKLSNEKVVIGGMVCLEKPPKKPYKLRWLYTKKRESISKNNKVICSSNFFIKKITFAQNPFDESIKKYGCEDVVFFDSILKKNIEILFIKNPVLHDALDDANTFIIKSEEAIENLIELLSDKKLNISNYNVSIVYEKLKKIRLTNFVDELFIITKSFLIKNFNSSHPSLVLFDLYRLGYFCHLKNKK